MDSSKKFDYKVIRQFAVLSKSGSITKEFNLVSYNGNRPKFDLRSWKTEEDGSRKPYKGLTLTDEEVKVLKTVFFSGVLEDEEAQEPEEIRNETENGFEFPYKISEDEEIEISAEDLEDLIED